MKKIYLASPYSHKDPIIQEKRFYHVCVIAGRLMQEQNVAIFSPIAHSYPIYLHSAYVGDGFDYWRPFNESWIDWCDELWVADMSGRDESKGIKQEVAYAKDTGKAVVWL